MNEPMNENQVKNEFRRLRETEMQAAPNYRQSLAGAEPRRRFRPAIRFATAFVVLVAAISIFLNTGHDQPQSEMAETVPQILEKVDLIAALEMPTDFLLDTPWFELAWTTPDFDIEIPLYDIPKELSDET